MAEPEMKKPRELLGWQGFGNSETSLPTRGDLG